MSDQPGNAEAPLRAVRPIERLAEARWPLAATALVVAVCVAAGRLGVFEGILALGVVALAVIAAPRTRTLAGGGRPRTESIVGPQTLAVLAGLPDPVLLLDARGVVLAFNDHAHTALGDVRTGDPVSFALRVPEVLDAVRRARDGGAPRVVLYVERTPIERWREATVAMTRVGRDGPAAIVVAFRDLTEQRRSERMRADFVANASHELRTPLASLLGFVETLQGPARNDPVARERFLEIMRGQANRMSRLIDDLLSLSRIELKAHLRPRDLVDMGAVARGVSDALAPLARERGVEIQIEVDEPELWVRGDRDELFRVVENLVENAIKYGHAGKLVELQVGADPASDAVRLSVRDHGPGIAPEHLPRLTERFYRVDVADSREKGGTGLGLALVKHVVQRHGGRLLIDSAAGAGATFSVVIERSEATPAAAEAELRQAS